MATVNMLEATTHLSRLVAILESGAAAESGLDCWKASSRRCRSKILTALMRKLQ